MAVGTESYLYEYQGKHKRKAKTRGIRTTKDLGEEVVSVKVDELFGWIDW